MNETFPSVAFPDASHEQIRTLTTRLVEQVIPQSTAHVILKELIGDAKSILATHEMVLNRPIGSDLAPVTKNIDGKRDKATKIFLGKVYTAAEDFDSETATFAKAVKMVCDDHGGKGITSLKLSEQTDLTRRLLAILKTPEMMAKVEFLGLAKDLLLVEQFNNEFETTWKQRIIEKPEAGSIPAMKDIRREIDGTLFVFLKNLNWLLKREKTGLSDASKQAIRTLLVELSSDLKAQVTVKATAEAKAKAAEQIVAQ